MSEERTHRIHLALERGYRFTASFPDVAVSNAIALDEPAPLGDGHGPNASALLGAAVGNCLGASLLFCLHKSRVEIPMLEVDVTVKIVRNEAGRFRIGAIEVEMDPRVPSEAAAQLSRCETLFEDFCIVTESVRSGIPVSVRVRQTSPV